MEHLIDFTNCKIGHKSYGGSMPKLSIIYNDSYYMLKFQDEDETHYKDSNGEKIVTYINSIFSEYIASHFANNIGLDCHSTLLGFYQYPNEDEVYRVVACKDFLKQDEIFVPFQQILKENFSPRKRDSLKVQTIEGTISAIENQIFFNSQALKEHFFEMLVFDSYIGNFDRNPNNWGVILNTKTGNKKLAPIFDNDSCLHPKTPRDLIEKYLFDEILIRKKSILTPTMYFKKSDNLNQREEYISFLKHFENEDFFKAVKKIAPKILDKHKENMQFLQSLTIIDPNRRLLLEKELDLRIDIFIKPLLEKANNYDFNPPNNDNSSFRIRRKF